MTVGYRIKSWRILRNMTQAELAQRVGTTKQNISRYEKDEIKDIPMRQISRIAAVLGTTPADLLGFGHDTDISGMTDEQAKLHRIIDEASYEQLKLIDLLLSLPTEQIEALAALLRAGR